MVGERWTGKHLQRNICGLVLVEVEVTLRLMVSQSECLLVGHPLRAHYQILLFPFFRRKIALLFVLGRPLWREDGSVICSTICEWSELRRTHNHTLLSHPRLLGSLSIASYDSQGLWRKYSYPPPRGEHSIVILAFAWTGWENPRRALSVGIAGFLGEFRTDHTQNTKLLRHSYTNFLGYRAMKFTSHLKLASR
jgi:hypothetical protein